MKSTAVWLLTALTFLPIGQALAADLKPYDARYEVQRGGSNYGEAVRSLVRNEDGSFHLHNETEISFLFLSDVRRYDAQFSFEDNRVSPQEFYFKRSGTGRNKSLHVRFDNAAQQVIEVDSGAPLPIEWNPQLIDEASMLEQLRFDLTHQDDSEFTYTIVDDKGEHDTQKFSRGELETLRLPYGEVEAVKVQRVRENSRRETLFWFAPAHDFVLVKMQQRKEGDEVATLLLEQLN
ncbi:DUF3108 domain-containing protein [Pseudidiomarina salilacus]|uniref:DUF3108 domain-containing protein n=1 Tax=Pseudidiomarina salilacus TaxID=3384452 RepID=UPI003984F563